MADMKRSLLILASVVIAAGQICFADQASAAETNLETLLRKFKKYCGADLVFHRTDLPDGRYHDVLKPLADSQKVIAAAICLEEARMYPPRFFAEVGLKTVGVFAACASKTTSDRSRPYDEQLGGYRYFARAERIRTSRAGRTRIRLVRRRRTAASSSRCEA
jgi:hypothetical protein